jgi:hypothetical protein
VGGGWWVDTSRQHFGHGTLKICRSFGCVTKWSVRSPRAYIITLLSVIFSPGLNSVVNLASLSMASYISITSMTMAYN